jgi:outer membrane biosynthesis protein TonB
MRRSIGILAALFILSVFLVSSGHSQTTRTRVFRSAEVVTASDVKIPFNSVANGIVELYLTISATGTVDEVVVARPLASVTEEAVRAVKTWTFAPATMHGKQVTSQLTVCVVFCPLAYQTPDLPLTPIVSQSQNAAPGAALPAISPEVTEAKYPPDGYARLVGATVVLRVLVGTGGQPGLVRVVKDAPSMTDSARAAVAGWKFSPAQMNGKPVISGIILAFAFRIPIVNSY